MPKLLAYKKADRTLHTLACTSISPCLGMLLQQLLVSPADLAYISISSITAATVSCLSAFTGLLSCELYQPSESSINLQPLAALSKLEDLTLHGAHFHCFHGLQLGDHLSGLFVNSAVVTCEVGSAEPVCDNIKALLAWHWYRCMHSVDKVGVAVLIHHRRRGPKHLVSGCRTPHARHGRLILTGIS